MSGSSDANSKAIAATETAKQHEHWRHAADRAEADSDTRTTDSDTGNL
jgi:hypothetical protein